MSKYIKITLIFLIIIFFMNSLCFATNIDMNLSSDNNFSDETDITSNSIRNSDRNNNVSNADNTSTTVKSVNQSYTDDGLGLSNILNIILIVIGIVIILLSIAILIRLHG